MQPRKQVISALQDELDKGSGTELLNTYRKLRATHPDDYNFSDESALNLVGYTLLSKKHYESAIAIFEYNKVMFPQSGNALKAWPKLTSPWVIRPKR